MKIVLLAASLLSPALLWAQDGALLASANPDLKLVESVTTTPPRPAAPALMTAPSKPGSDASAFVGFVEGRADCRIGLMAIAVKNLSDKPMVAVVETAVYYSYHNVTTKDIRIDNFGPGEVRTVGCKGKVETATGDTHSVIRLKAAMFK